MMATDHSNMSIMSKVRSSFFAMRGNTGWERALIHLNRIFGLIYLFVISGLLMGITFLYVTRWNKLIRQLMPVHLFIIHTTITVYLLVNISVNYAMALLVRPSARPRGADLEAPPNFVADMHANPLTRGEVWRVCTSCDAPKPPRTHHCSTCNECYVRLCHHCIALGRCVARDNYPYFFRFVVLASIGSIFAAITCRWLMKQGARDSMLLTVVIGGSAIAISSGTLAIWHIYLVATAQTTIEWLENWRVRRNGSAPPEWGKFGGPFSRSLRANIQDALGTPTSSFFPWWTVFFIPFPRSAQRDDG